MPLQPREMKQSSLFGPFLGQHFIFFEGAKGPNKLVFASYLILHFSVM